MALSGTVFSVEVVQRADAAGEPVYWANRWEFETDVISIPVSPQTIAQAFATFHRNALLTPFFVDYVRISTYAPDGQPYNPDALYVLPINQRGLRGDVTAAQTVLPITNVVHVRKLVGSGRLGHLFLRGMLQEADIQSDPNSGAVSLVTAGDISATIEQSFAALNTALGASGRVALVSGSGLIVQSREVTGLSLAGVTTRSLRTRRKGRLLLNSAQRIAATLAGGLTVDEIPEVVEDIGRVLSSLGIPVPGN